MATQRVRYREEIAVSTTANGAVAVLGTLAPNFPGLDLSWPDGTSEGKSNRFWCDLGRSIADGANDDLDLRSLANGPAGATISFIEVRAIFLHFLETNTTVVTMSPGAANGWTALGASMSMAFGRNANARLITPRDGLWPTGASDKVLRFANAAGAAALYNVLIVGTSA